MNAEELAEGKRLWNGNPESDDQNAFDIWVASHMDDLLAAEERAQRAEAGHQETFDSLREEVVRQSNRAATAERERDEARKVLREFEWEACSETLPNYDGPNIVQCRVCHGRRDDGGHAAGCRVDRALGGGK